MDKSSSSSVGIVKIVVDSAVVVGGKPVHVVRSDLEWGRPVIPAVDQMDRRLFHHHRPHFWFTSQLNGFSATSE